MYLPNAFEESDPAVLHALVRAHPLGTWVVSRAGGLEVNHVPFLLEPGRGTHGTLLAHVARANPVWRELAQASDSVVVFQGPEAYVTPSWYPGKAVHGKVVPTWNYAVVHAHGRPRAVEDRDGLRDLVGRLTRTHEAGRAAPWSVDDAPAEYVERMLAAIVGIEIPLERLVGKWKVSQNRDAAERAGVVQGLQAQGDAASLAMAALVGGARPSDA